MTSVLLSLQHSFEMLLKAALLATGDKTVFDKRKRMAIGMESCINRCQQQVGIKLSDSEAGTIRVLDNLRDGEQHWHQVVDEGLLYTHSRAAVTLFDDLLHRVWEQRLSEHLPLRVLPISSEPPQELDFLIDREYSRIADLLQPGRRATAEAKGRIRSLLATEALSDPDAIDISESDVDRTARGIREGKDRQQVFPKLTGITSESSGTGLAIEVRFVKTDGLAVTFTKDPAAETAAIREVDLERKFHMGAYDLADRAGVGRVQATALRRHLGLDDANDHFSHVFKFGSQRVRRYSDNALRAMHKNLEVVDIKKIWDSHRTISWKQTKPAPPCNQPGCVAPPDTVGELTAK
ncbi:hypothetical protein [Pseudoclavibacter sp. Z016]|uniref:hypothetical protein n=1 Tax=Pseudoclavibacter sp. Z016 TaxID=2080581 RepID=UPI001CA5662A|nr:hypothetical protein [Pseudoclavibacter sp. Z016]